MRRGGHDRCMKGGSSGRPLRGASRPELPLCLRCLEVRKREGRMQAHTNAPSHMCIYRSEDSGTHGAVKRTGVMRRRVGRDADTGRPKEGKALCGMGPQLRKGMNDSGGAVWGWRKARAQGGVHVYVRVHVPLGVGHDWWEGCGGAQSACRCNTCMTGHDSFTRLCPWPGRGLRAGLGGESKIGQGGAAQQSCAPNSGANRARVSNLLMRQEGRRCTEVGLMRGKAAGSRGGGTGSSFCTPV